MNRVPEQSGSGNARVSVIIPAYNAARFVRQTIESVLSQGYSNCEIILVNDGSTDATGDVVATFRDRIVIVTQENRGLSGARNSGLAVATGEYVWFLDSDDVLLPGAIGKLATHLQLHPEVGIVAGCWDLVDELGRVTATGLDAGWARWTTGVLRRNPIREFLLRNHFPPCVILTRTSAVRACGGFDNGLRAFEDQDLWLRMARQGCRFEVVPVPVALYRRHPACMTLNISHIESNMLIFLSKWFEASPLDAETEGIKPYAYCTGWLSLAAKCCEARSMEEARRCWEVAHDWLKRARPDEEMARQVLGDIDGRPWELSTLAILRMTCPLLVAEHCWTRARLCLRDHQFGAACGWLRRILTKHPRLFLMKLRRVRQRCLHPSEAC
jgi:GT2 family glycosyltransferase